MISKRLIPLFLLKGRRLVKGKQFRDFVDVGDPLSQAMIYDAQGADEIIIVDIEASEKGRIINTNIINKMINNCNLPIAGGGGIKSIEDARRCFESGVDKIIVNTHAVLDPVLVKGLADEFGSQSVVVSLDVKKNNSGKYGVYVMAGKQMVDTELQPMIERFIEYGAGEILITSIDREGTLQGFDYDLYREIGNTVTVPLIFSGGAGCYDDMVKLFKETDCDACAIGKMLYLRDYDIVRIKSYLKWEKILMREA